MAVRASANITLSFMVDVKAIYRYYKLQASTAAAPASPTTRPPTGWTDTEPSYTSGSTNTLYTCELTVFTNETFLYTPVSKSSSYEAAKEACNKAVNAGNAANEAAKTATNHMAYQAGKGLVIGNMTDEQLGKNVLIDSDSVDIRDGDKVVASFGETVKLGEGNENSPSAAYIADKLLSFKYGEAEAFKVNINKAFTQAIKIFPTKISAWECSVEFTATGGWYDIYKYTLKSGEKIEANKQYVAEYETGRNIKYSLPITLVGNSTSSSPYIEIDIGKDVTLYYPNGSSVANVTVEEVSYGEAFVDGNLYASNGIRWTSPLIMNVSCDDITINGTYSLTGSITSLPTYVSSGVLIVSSDKTQYTVYHKLISSNGVYERFKIGNAWTAWKETVDYLPLTGGKVTGYIDFAGTSKGLSWVTADGTVYKLRPWSPTNVFQITRTPAGGSETGVLNISTTGASLEGTAKYSEIAANATNAYTCSGNAATASSALRTQTTYFQLGTNGAALDVISPQSLILSASGEVNYKVQLGVSDGAWAFVPYVHGKLDLGRPNHRWLQIYANNSAISTSDKTQKHDIATADAAKMICLLMKIRPVTYKMNEGTSGRIHHGFIAQDVEQALAECGISDMEFAAFIKSPKYETVQVFSEEYLDEETFEIVPAEMYEESVLVPNEYIYGLRYEEFIAPILSVVQSQQAQIDDLQSQINDMKATLNKILEAQK